MHIFLTGEIHVGKSTIIDKVLKKLEDVDMGGFRTIKKSDVADTLGSVYIVSAREEEPVCSGVNRVGLKVGNAAGFIAFPEVFETRGIDLLNDAPAHRLILMDEIGRMEREAPKFSMRVLDLLEGDVPVFGVARKLGETTLLNTIRTHKNVKLIEITEENRDSMVDVVHNLIRRELYLSSDSAGAIVLRQHEGRIQTLMAKSTHNAWIFPKGHIEHGETRQAAAVREIKEETGVDVRLIPPFEVVIPSALASEKRQVSFFLAEPVGGELRPQPGETTEVEWKDIDEVEPLLRFEMDAGPFKAAVYTYKFLKKIK